jgi:hypothetical protein
VSVMTRENTRASGGLIEQVASQDNLDPDLLERMRHEVLTAPDGWKAEYGEYQSGGWWTLSLINATGQAGDVTIADCDPVETTLLAKMPVTRHLLRALGLRYMWVRLARLAPHSFLWEHRDYAELADVERHRLHIPLLTNSSAFLVTGATKVHLSAGRIWRLTPTYAHGVCNLLGPDRIHLILDCYADDRLAELTSDQHLPDGAVELLPPATDADVVGHMAAARGLADMGYLAEAERYLLRLFYAHTMPEGCGYELVARLHEQLDNATAASEWRAKADVMLARNPATAGSVDEARS